MDVSKARRLKPLEKENNPLKKPVADLSLDNSRLKELLSKIVRPSIKTNGSENNPPTIKSKPSV